MTKFASVGVVGGGLIGMSWTSLFLARGCRVIVVDPDPEAKSHLDAFLPLAWENLKSLGLTQGDDMPRPISSDDYSILAGVDYVFIARQQTGQIAWPRLLDDMEKALISLASTLHEPAG